MLVALAVCLAIGTAFWVLLVLGIGGTASFIVALLVCLAGTAVIAAVAAYHFGSSLVASSDSMGDKYRVRRTGLAQVVELAAAEVPGVEDLTSNVRGGSHGLKIECLARVHPPFNPIDVKQRLSAHLESELPWMTGLPVSSVAIRFIRPPLAESEGLW
jgi:hypothetical protein